MRRSKGKFMSKIIYIFRLELQVLECQRVVRHNTQHARLKQKKSTFFKKSTVGRVTHDKHIFRKKV